MNPIPPARVLAAGALMAISAPPAIGQPLVNEIMARNETTLADPQGEFDDWVELFNPGVTDLDLRGYHVSDDADDVAKWVIAGDGPVLIPAGGYRLLWLDNDEEDGPDHLPFRLAAGGDVFILTASDGETVIDQVALPPQHPDIAYGRSGDHGNQFRYLINPTPGAANDSVGVAVLEGIIFSHEAGTFVDGFDLALATTSDGATIRFTLDGAVPTSSGGQVYDAPLTIDETTCVRAALFLGTAQISPVETRVFLALDDAFAAFGSNLPIVLIDSAGYDFSNDDDPRTDYPAKPVCAGIFEIGTGGRATVADPAQFLGRAGMNVRGASSKTWPKKQFKFETWDEEDGDRDVSILGMPADADWLLQAPYFDRSLMRNDFVFHWWRELGYYSPRTRFVEVFLKPESGGNFSMEHYRGVYVLTEKIKRSADRMDVARLDPDDLAEPEITGGYIAQATNINEDWVSGEGTRYKYVEPSQADPLPPQKAWLQSYVEAAEDSVYAADFTDPTNGYAKYLDVPSQIDYDIMRELSRNADGASTFFSIDRGGKLKMGPLWDYNQALGLSSLGTAALGNSWDTFGWNRYYMRANHWLAWWDRLDDDPLYQRAWNDRWVSLRESILTTGELLGRIDSVAALLDEAQVRNFEKWDILGQVVWAPNGNSRADPGETTRDTYAKEIAFLRDWVAARVQWIDSQVPSPPDFTQNGGAVPEGFSLTVNEGMSFGAFSGDIYYTIDGSDPAAPGASPMLYAAPLVLDQSVEVRARTLDAAGDWSALRAATFIVGTQTPSSAALTISEIHYNPDGPDDLEFIEIANRGASPVNLTGVRLATAVTFEFSAAELVPGGTILVVENEGAFRMAFGSEIDIAGQWSGRLNNTGETIDLMDAGGAILHRVAYGEDGDWPSEADGDGFSLQQIALETDPSLASSWRLSSFENGSPGSVPAVGGMTFETWQSEHFTPAQLADPELSGATADPERDGLFNLLEFGFAKNPFQSEAGAPFRVATDVIEVGGVPHRFLTLTFERPAESDLQYVLQRSANLSDWTTRPMVLVRSEMDVATEVETITVREKNPIAGSGAAHIRIRVAN